MNLQLVRMTRNLIVVEEPFFDPRSEEKKRTCEVTRIFLDLNKEVGFSHVMYLEPGELLNYLREKNLSVESRVKKSYDLLTFDDYFGAYMPFIVQSERKVFGRV